VENRQSQDLFRAEITAHDADVITLQLFGELDLVSMPLFQTALAAVLARKPRQLIFDISAAQFISGQGFTAFGQCGREIERVGVRSGSGLAVKILSALGYNEVECIETTVP
jgi:anti-anti-sigma regulatory factor